MTPAVVTGVLPAIAYYSTARDPSGLDRRELVGHPRRHQEPAEDGGTGIRRRQIRERLGCSHGRLIDTVADPRAVAAGDVEREVRVNRVVVGRAAAASRMRASLEERAFDLE